MSDAELEHAFGQASGPSIESFHAIGVRGEMGNVAGRKGESHLVEAADGHAYAGLSTVGSFAGVWRSLEGGVHLAHRDGALFTKRADGDYWRFDVRASLLGVFGLDEDHVYAWGLRGTTPVMFRYASGGTWLPFAAPHEIIFAMAGDRPDRLLAVGMKGKIWAWDGARWEERSSPVTGALSSIHWVSEDEIYACGTGCPFVLEGSIYGWVRHGPFEVPLHCVAKFAGSVWIGCGLSGLRRFVAGETELEVVKPLVRARHFDARRELLMSTPEQIVGTADGETFRAFSLDVYRDLVRPLAPAHP